MVYALSCMLLPGTPYTPGIAGALKAQRSGGGLWNLDECLKCARARGCSSLNGSLMDTCGIPGSRRNLLGARHVGARGIGLSEEMARAGWFDR
ncbi:hypothetical protein BJV78DRAFT_1261471 [Lactifluus subvellereus]|nr:hypothetical protein BJV78DRAFT_1261471 [Lactifluus subvellereus]